MTPTTSPDLLEVIHVYETTATDRRGLHPEHRRYRVEIVRLAEGRYVPNVYLAGMHGWMWDCSGFWQDKLPDGRLLLGTGNVPEADSAEKALELVRDRLKGIAKR